MKQETAGNKDIEENDGSLAGKEPDVEKKSNDAKAVNGEELTEDEKNEVSKLRQRDTEVKAHEQAHMAAGGSLVRGGPHYKYQQGPDGKRYAVGGEVSIDTSEEKTPDQTIIKMERVKAAALAPAEPSSQDRSVAASATQKAAAARIEEMQSEEPGGTVLSGSKAYGERNNSDGPSDPVKSTAENADANRRSFQAVI